MKCADPVLCYTDGSGNRKFKNFSFAVKSAGGIPTEHIVFDCGKCLTCRKKRSYELACRCVLHASLFNENCFLTLTYDEKKPGYENKLDYSHIQKFKKNFRNHVDRKYDRKISIFNVHEFGKNGKKHWHLIVFNFNFFDKEIYTYKNGLPLYTSKWLEKLWPFGFNTIGDVSEASALYQAQYTQKDFKNGNVTNEKKAHSKHAGIGKPYFLKHYEQILTLGYIPFNGKKLPVPRYFQKLARKHWAYFYEPSLFFSNSQRKRVFTPFSGEAPNKGIADLFIGFTQLKNERILDLEKNWEEILNTFLTTKSAPDFMIANDNALYDLKQKNLKEIF